MKRFFSIFLCLIMVLTVHPVTAHADTAWPENVSIQSESGIVMDADTGTVLYGKNIHQTYYPASITKILTALLVLEHCEMDDMVTFSHNAVYNVEPGSSSAGLDEGDIISVKDCLYALMLKSANEAANALAEHVGGTVEGFAEMMNEKAASLGCQDSHFANPSGLNNPDHYVSAYDMALIGQAALQNEDFIKINSTLYYDLPVTKRNPEGGRIYPGHKMLKKNLAEYYEGCLGGKTGYTSLAGNTLVTFARRGDMTLVSVTLKGQQTQYSDTKALLDFGFQNFQSVSASAHDTTYTSVDNDMTIAGLTTSELSGLQLDPDDKVTIPKDADFSAVSSEISYELTDDAPEDAIARIDYRWGQRKIGSAYLNLKTVDRTPVSLAMEEAAAQLAAEQALAESALTSESISHSVSPEESSSKEPGDSPESIFHVPGIVWTLLGIIAVALICVSAFLALRVYLEKKEERARMLRRQRRMKRLEDSGVSSAQFDLLMEQRRSSRARQITSSSKKRRRRSHIHRR